MALAVRNLLVSGKQIPRTLSVRQRACERLGMTMWKS